MKFSGTLSHPSRQDKARLSRLLPVDAAYLENLVRFTGVLVALVASFLAAPEATRHRWTWLRTHAVTTSQTVAAQSRATAAQAKRAWRRLLGRRPPPRIVPVGQVAEHVTIHPAAIVTSAQVFPVDPALPLAASLPSSGLALEHTTRGPR